MSNLLNYIKKKINLIGFVIVLVVIGFLIDSDNSKMHNKYNHYSYDSASLFLDREVVGEFEQPVGNTLIYKLSIDDTSAQFKKLLNRYHKIALKLKDQHAIGFYYVVSGRLNKYKIGMDSFAKCQKKAIQIGKKYYDTSILLNSISVLSSSYLFNNELDSGLYYSRVGYDIALKSKRPTFIFFFAVNLGYVMNGKMLTGAAQMYFEQALKYSAGNESNKLVLFNNLVSIMITEKKYKEAEDFWEKNIENRKLDFNTYEGQILAINRSFLYQNQNKWNESQEWIQKIKHIKDVPGLKLNFLRLRLCQFNHEHKNLSEILLQNRKFLMDEFPYSFAELSDFITDEIKRNPNFISIQEFLELEKEFVNDVDDDYNKSALYLIKSAVFESRGDVQQALTASKKAMEYKLKFDDLESESRHADLAEKLRLMNLLEQIEQSKIELENQNKQTNIFKIITALLIALSLLVLYLVFKERKNRLLKEQLLTKELENEKLLAENLTTENELNNRIITLSKMIITKVEYINKLLSGVNEVNYSKAIKEIRTEFLSIQNTISDAQPQLADKLLEDYSDIQVDFPDITLLSITEKRIFVLSINGYPTKEIAGLLSLTSQYVNNARTSIRKKLGIEENWKEVLLNKKNPNLRSSE